MAFTQAWNENDPDGSVVTVSQMDNFMRAAKAQIRERLEGDPANLQLSGVYESSGGGFSSAAVVKKGVARTNVDTFANIGTYTLQDGRLFIASDTGRMYHLKGSGAIELQYLPLSGGTVTGGVTITTGGLTINAGGMAVVGNSAITGTLTVSSTINSQTISSAANFTGTVTIATGLTVSAGGAAVTGASTFSSTINGQTITSAASFTGTITVATGLTVSAGGAAITGAVTTSSTINGQTITSAASFTGTLTVASTLTVSAGGASITGTVTTSSTINGQTISSAANFTGTLTVASTSTFNDNVTIAGASVTRSLTINTATVQQRDILFQTNAATRWRIRINNNAEGGSNAGSDFNIDRFNDAGAAIETALGIFRASGTITIGQNIQFLTSAPKLIGGTTNITFRNNADNADNLVIDNAGNLNSRLGYQVAGAAASGQYLRGDGTRAVFSAIQSGDLPSPITQNISTGSLVVGSGAAITKILSNTVVWDIPSTNAGNFSSTTVTVTGAAVGDPVFISKVHSADTFEAWNVAGYVNAADTVTLIFKNTSGVAVDPGSRTVRVIVFHV